MQPMSSGFGWGFSSMPAGWLLSAGGTIPVPGPGDVGPLGMMSIPAASRCVRLISSSVAKLRLRVRRADSGLAETPVSADVRRFLLRPNPLQTWRIFKRTLESHRQRYGNGFARAYPANRAPGVPPEELVTCLPYSVQFVVPERGAAYYTVRGERVEVADMLHIRDDGEDGLLGESKVVAARRVLEVAAQADESAKVLMRNLGVAKVAIELQGPEGPKVRQEVAAEYEKNHGGSENSGKPIVTSGGAKVHALNVDLINEAWIDARAWDAQQCSRIWGVPTPFLSDFSGTGGYGSLEVLVRMLWDHCLADIIGEWDEEVNRVAFGAYAEPLLEHDIDDVVRGTAQEVAGALASLTREAIISTDEARETLDKPPAPAGFGGFRAPPSGSSGGSGAGGPVPGIDTQALAGRGA